MSLQVVVERPPGGAVPVELVGGQAGVVVDQGPDAQRSPYPRRGRRRLQRRAPWLLHDHMNIGPIFDAVLAAAQAGAPWAQHRLYEWLAGPVAGFLRAQGVAEPEDVTSEVFLSVFAGVGSFRGSESQFRSWVFTIAYRRMIDARRARARVPATTALEASSANGDGPAPSAEDEALQSMGTDRVERILRGLPSDQRDVLALRVIADLTVDQVAAALGKKPGAVKALQRRALAGLRRRLVAEGVPL